MEVSWFWRPLSQQKQAVTSGNLYIGCWRNSATYVGFLTKVLRHERKR